MVQLRVVVSAQAVPSEVATVSILSAAASVTSLADIETLGKEEAAGFESDASTAPKTASIEVRVLRRVAAAAGDEEEAVVAVSARRSFAVHLGDFGFVGMTTVDDQPPFGEAWQVLDPSRMQIFEQLAGVDADAPQHGGRTDSSSRGLTQPTGKCRNRS